MTKDEKERIQYLLTQWIEGRETGRDAALPEILNREQDELETVLVELMAAEPALPGYDRGRWEELVRVIIRTPAEGKEGSQLPAGVPEAAIVPRVLIKRWVWTSAAAVILLVGIWFIYTGNRERTIATNYGQQKKIVLPDETEIILNAHSNIRYPRRWKTGSPREVWLEGEALFRVRHINRDTGLIQPGERFIVHTALAEVEVLGTVFNIRERRGKTAIVLQEGRIKVTFTKKQTPAVMMQPGQIVTTDSIEQKVGTGTTRPEEYTAWTKNKLVLTNAAFSEIVEYMEDNFGKQVVLTDPALAGRKVEGTFKMDNLDDALLVLSKALNVEIEQRGDTLVLTSK